MIVVGFVTGTAIPGEGTGGRVYVHRGLIFILLRVGGVYFRDVVLRSVFWMLFGDVFVEPCGLHKEPKTVRTQYVRNTFP